MGYVLIMIDVLYILKYTWVLERRLHLRWCTYNIAHHIIMLGILYYNMSE